MTTTLDPKAIKNLVKARKALFQSSTRAQRRVLVAQDVLNQIDLGTYIPKERTWVDIFENVDSPNSSLQKAILSKEVTCQCCALGSLMLSNVGFCNNIKTDNADNDLRFSELRPLTKSLIDPDILTWQFIAADKIKDKSDFLKLFSSKQLMLIEFAFEGGVGQYSKYSLKKVGFDDKIIQRALLFTNESDSRQRLIGIMENIVKNDGKFVP